MEDLIESEQKREKESRRELFFFNKIEKDIQEYEFKKNQIENIKKNYKESEGSDSSIIEKKKLEKVKEKIYTKKNSLQYATSEENINQLFNYCCYYDIFSYARHGHYENLEKLFLMGINPDSKDIHGNTLLIIAAQNNNKRILKLCLRYGAQINMQNLMGNTALHFAKEYEYDTIYEYLIQKGADPKIKNLRGIEAQFGLYGEEDRKLFLGDGLKFNNKTINLK